MDFCATLFLLFFGCVLCSRFPQRQYHYVQLPMNWIGAQSYCREHYADLATFESAADIQTLKADFLYQWAWLGLRDAPQVSDTWRWSMTGETSRTGYQAWKHGEPNNYAGKENCVAMNTKGEWNDSPCNARINFVCYSVANTNHQIYHYIALSRTWSSAWKYCRAHYTDLAWIENQVENSQVLSVKPASAQVWIGLYRGPWTWSDMSQSSFRNWKTVSADIFIGNRSCAVENPLHEWSYLPCEDKHPFICQQVPRQKMVVRMKAETEADLTDPAVNAQLLQQFSAALTSGRSTNFTLRWKVQPRKQEKPRLTDPVPPSTCKGLADL
ncbi:C-type mannose receptor 2-like [Hippoglossus hippoglossus]|uniref:C-type mannose receptor 2-like n=1 Tax=Hippoglossus hippoglossus TaxID=8267 RepID=UPI00148E8763|nr:C-type mannose receptor 2-like [Hippoglossus hippoglossus]